MDFLISQGSVETFCMLGGNLRDMYIENFLTNHLVKEFWNRSTITFLGQMYVKCLFAFEYELCARWLCARWSQEMVQEAQLSLTNRAMLVCKVVEVWQDFLSEYVDKKFTYICYRRLIRHEWIYYGSKNCVIYNSYKIV